MQQVWSMKLFADGNKNAGREVGVVMDHAEGLMMLEMELKLQNITCCLSMLQVGPANQHKHQVFLQTKYLRQMQLNPLLHLVKILMMLGMQII